MRAPSHVNWSNYKAQDHILLFWTTFGPRAAVMFSGVPTARFQDTVRAEDILTSTHLDGGSLEVDVRDLLQQVLFFLNACLEK